MNQEIYRHHTGPRMSKIIEYGGLIYLCGQTAGGSNLTSIEGQTNEALARIDSLLAEVGSNRGRLLSVTIHLKSMADFSKMNECWENWLVGYAAPARTTVQAALATDSLLVEFSVVAAAGK